ncbi:MAG: hypothetical protein AAB113_01020, partial [Candidatus Eisenbacteria bacterium]
MLSRRGFIRSLAAGAAAPSLFVTGTAARAGSRTAAPPWPADGDPDYWAKLRRQFYLRDDEVFFNTATLGAPPRVVVDAVASSMRDLAGTIAQWDYKPDRPNWFTGYYAETPIRRKLAGLLHAEVEELA